MPRCSGPRPRGRTAGKPLTKRSVAIANEAPVSAKREASEAAISRGGLEARAIIGALEAFPVHEKKYLLMRGRLKNLFLQDIEAGACLPVDVLGGLVARVFTRPLVPGRILDNALGWMDAEIIPEGQLDAGDRHEPRVYHNLFLVREDFFLSVEIEEIAGGEGRRSQAMYSPFLGAKAPRTGNPLEWQKAAFRHRCLRKQSALVPRGGASSRRIQTGRIFLLVIFALREKMSPQKRRFPSQASPTSSRERLRPPQSRRASMSTKVIAVKEARVMDAVAAAMKARAASNASDNEMTK